MIVETKRIEVSGYPAIELTSDAADDNAAMHEFEDWCRRNNAGPAVRDWVAARIENGATLRTGLVYPAESAVEQGEQVYRQKVRRLVEPEHIGKVAAIDCDTGDYEVAENEIVALDALERRNPGARAYLKRIGYMALEAIGTTIPRSPDN